MAKNQAWSLYFLQLVKLNVVSNLNLPIKSDLNHLIHLHY